MSVHRVAPTDFQLPIQSSSQVMAKTTDKSLESWIWDAACSIRGAKDAPKYKDYILPEWHLVKA